MGKRGPKPTPTGTLKARDSWRANERTDADAPLFPPGEPGCPSWLSAEAKAEWRRIVPQLLDAGVLSVANRTALTEYCICWGRLHEAEKHIAEKGAVYVSQKTGVEYQSPWVAISSNAMDKLMRLTAAFGMTPADAGKVQRATAAEPETNENDKGKYFKTVG